MKHDFVQVFVRKQEKLGPWMVEWACRLCGFTAGTYGKRPYVAGWRPYAHGCSKRALTKECQP